jgi:hypothetical protein
VCLGMPWTTYGQIAMSSGLLCRMIHHGVHSLIRHDGSDVRLGMPRTICGQIVMPSGWLHHICHVDLIVSLIIITQTERMLELGTTDSYVDVER